MSNKKPKTETGHKPVSNTVEHYRAGLDRNKTVIQTGSIVSIHQDAANFIHAIIVKDSKYSPDPSLDSNLLFNKFDTGTMNEHYPLAPLLIPITNLINSKYENLETFIGMPVDVTVLNNVAVSAVVKPVPFLKYSEQKTIERILTDKRGLDLINNFADFEKEVEGLLGFTVSDMGSIPMLGDNGKLPTVIVTSKGVTTDQIIQADTVNKNRTVVPETPLLKSNQLIDKLKTALCHTPAKFLSGK